MDHEHKILQLEEKASASEIGWYRALFLTADDVVSFRASWCLQRWGTSRLARQSAALRTAARRPQPPLLLTFKT